MTSRFWRCLGFTGYFGSFTLLLLWFGFLEPPSRIPVALTLLGLVGPLLFPLRGLLAGRQYTYAWSSFLALFYFLVGAFNAAGPMRLPWLAWLEMILSVSWFLGAILYVRTSARSRQAARTAATSPTGISANPRADQPR